MSQLKANSQEKNHEKGNIPSEKSVPDSHGSEPSGNTNNQKARAWMITWNNYTEDDILYVLEICKEKCEDFVFQTEIGLDKKTPHLQIFIKFQNQYHFETVRKMFKNNHIEKCRNADKAKLYCSKNDLTFSGRRWEKQKAISKRRDIVIPINENNLFDWQKNIVNLMNGPIEERKIYWYFDKIGNTGKSTFTRFMVHKYPNKVLAISGKASDIKYGVMSFLENQDNDLYMCIFDFERTNEEYISYSAIEQVKNGLFYNTKYESKMVLFNKPQIIIFANFKPDLKALSLDRWVITELTNSAVSTPPAKIEKNILLSF